MMFCVYPIVAKHFEMFFGDVDDQFLNEVQSRNGFSNKHILSDNIRNIKTISKLSIFVLVPINIFTSIFHVVAHLRQRVHTLGNVYESFF